MRDSLRGVLLGTAVGDALGLPAEGLAPRRAARLFPRPWRHRLLPGRGMLSDDTEHALFVAQCLLAHPGDARAFQRRLGWCLRGWLLSLPAGVGFATLRACLKLLAGVPPPRSGVWSAGNGPAMRAAPIGAFLALDGARRREFTAASTLITHTDPRALTGAGAVAELTAWIVRGGDLRTSAGEAVDLLAALGTDDSEWQGRVDAVRRAHAAGTTVPAFAESLGLGRGVTGYVHHTVPVALYAVIRHPVDFAGALTGALDCGGDTDTVGAITGAVAGAAVGEGGIPPGWTAGIADWPRGTALLREVADRLARATPGTEPGPGPVPYAWPAVPLRNALFLAVVLAHGVRRLLPPY